MARPDRPRTGLTARGIGSFAVGLALGAGAIIVRVDELYAVSAAALLLPLVGFIRLRIAARRVVLSASIGVAPRRPEVGRPISVRITMQTPTRLTPALKVSVDAPFSTGVEEQLVAGLPRGATHVVDLDGIASRRGRFTVGPAKIALVDGFGFASATWSVGNAHDILVLPSFTPVRAMPTLSADESGPGAGKRSPQRGSEFHALRQYQRGDDLRQIHWRATARHGTLLIRELEPLAMPRLTVLLDDRSMSHSDAETLEWAVSAAASVLSGAGARGFGVRLVTSDARTEPVAYGRTATEKLIERLAVVQRSGASTLEAAAASVATTGRGGALVVVLGPRCDAASLDAIAALRRRQGWAGAFVVDATNADAGIATALISSGWNVVGVRPRVDRIEAVWKAMLERPSGRASQLLRS